MITLTENLNVTQVSVNLKDLDSFLFRESEGCLGKMC